MYSRGGNAQKPQKSAKTVKKCYRARKILKIDFGIGFSRMARRTFRCQRRFRLDCFAIFAIVNLSNDFAWQASKTGNIEFSMKVFFDLSAKVDRRCIVEAAMRRNRQKSAKTRKKCYPARKILKIDFGIGFSRMARHTFRCKRRFRFDCFAIFAIVNLSSDFAWQASKTVNIDFSMKVVFDFSAKVGRRCIVEAEMRKNRKKAQKPWKSVTGREKY